VQLVDEIRDAIEGEAKKLGQRYHAYHNALEIEHQRLVKRIKIPPTKQILTPMEWSIDPKFNPFHVTKYSKSIARSITKKIIDYSYVPNAPHVRSIAKSGGGERKISVFQIPDAAVSSYFYKNLLRKNRHRFSGYSYAYRDDRNAHFAIQDISVDLDEVSRVFVAEYDFSKFFDSIQHDYLKSQFEENGFSISPRDRSIIDAFVGNAGIGIPQGTSISLFLANLVCWRLDRSLERQGLKFARYADDTVIWSSDYSKVSLAAEIVSEFSSQAGVPINATKSKGIRVLCPEGMPCEFASRTSHVEFLGYSISVDSVGIKGASVAKIKRHINYILYKHLVKPLRGPILQSVTIPANDKDIDLLSALMSIRRYLYGNLSEEYVTRFLAGGSGRLFYKGVMSFYPLISDKKQMQDLDGWLVNQVWKAVRLRGRILDKKWHYNRWHSFPFCLQRNDFVDQLRSRKVHKKRLYAIPSFVIVYLALRKSVSEGGVLQMLARNEY
jgi:RNA-directed DNA polymerase